jgi:NAD(P)-dependent dehydrogenase (short-subunit alcohol dehydrogenase family)
MTTLKGKWALVTGASRGVGKQIARALAEEGAFLILHSRAEEHTRELARELSERTTVHTLTAELSNGDEVERLIDEALELSGGIDVVYNNAAIMTPWTEAHTTVAADYRTSFEVNVIALVRISDRLLPGMRTRGWGRIVNVTSGIENIRELLPYSMSKAAVDRYVRDCAPSLEGTGVIMSLLDPGWLRTDLGGSEAPNAVETVLPGALVPAKLPDDAPSGQFFNAQDYREDR